MEYTYLDNIKSINVRCKLQDINNVRGYAFSTLNELTDIANVSSQHLNQITTLIADSSNNTIKFLGNIDTGGILDNNWSIYNNTGNVDVQAYLTKSFTGGSGYDFGNEVELLSGTTYSVYIYSENDKNVQKLIHLDNILV